jgi:predicted nuclease with RNAse H fold
VRSLGIDVGVRKGLDIVLLTAEGPEDGAVVEATRRGARPEDLPEIVAELAPDVVAIDSPPAWGSDGRSRAAERALREFGIQSFGTPSGNGGGHPFYEWMEVGFQAFRAIAERFPRYRSGRDVSGTALEVFPHASSVVLAGCLPQPDESKRRWRAAVLAARGVEVEKLRSADQVDAALAAFTGLRALSGRFTALGDPLEGVIVVPAHALPPPPYRRCERPPRRTRQPHLPGLAPCGCGDPSCTAMTKAEFARGHDAKRKRLLWLRARDGDEAVRELERRGWDLPPEMR